MITKIKVLDKDGRETYSKSSKSGLKYFNSIEGGLQIYEYYGPVKKNSRIAVIFGASKFHQKTRLVYDSVYQDITIILEYDDPIEIQESKEPEIEPKTEYIYLVVNINKGDIHGCLKKRATAKRYIGTKSNIFRIEPHQVFDKVNG